MRSVAGAALLLAPCWFVAACSGSATLAGDGAVLPDGSGAIDLSSPGTDAGGGGGTAAMLAKRLRGKTNFLVGMGNDLAADHNNDGAFTLGVTLDVHYTYLVGLQHVCVTDFASCTISNNATNQCGWPDWNAGGSFVNVITDSSDAHGVTPMFTLYSMATCGENNFNSLVNDAYMGPYWDSAKLLFQRLAMFDKPAIVHLEPDFWAFAQQHAPGGDPTKVPVHVSALAPDCASFPDDLTGMGKCFLKLARQYSPKVVVGFHASEWAGTPAETGAFLNR